MTPTILIVDDESEIRELLQRHFRYLGYKVNTAEDGKDALDKLDEQRTDVVISDIKMPRMGGIDLLEAIRSDYPAIRVIMITGHVTQENILACMGMGAETCIFKPLEDLEMLERSVEKALATIKHWWTILAELQSHGPRSSKGGA